MTVGDVALEPATADDESAEAPVAPVVDWNGPYDDEEGD